jgi:3-methyl-2-oxobutanoate hydroxymethyltransferase
MGGYLVQGRDEAAARRIIHDATVLEQLGCYSLVLEGVPLELAKAVTEKVSIPTIGIGAGRYCDGQVLVCYDLLGMNPDFKPKFVKRYADLYGTIQQASREFFAEVRGETFPGEAHSFKSKALHLVASNPDRELGEREDKPGPEYGVPV